MFNTLSHSKASHTLIKYSHCDKRKTYRTNYRQKYADSFPQTRINSLFSVKWVRSAFRNWSLDHSQTSILEAFRQWHTLIRWIWPVAQFNYYNQGKTKKSVLTTDKKLELFSSSEYLNWFEFTHFNTGVGVGVYYIGKYKYWIGACYCQSLKLHDSDWW